MLYASVVFALVSFTIACLMITIVCVQYFCTMQKVVKQSMRLMENLSTGEVADQADPWKTFPRT